MKINGSQLTLLGVEGMGLVVLLNVAKCFVFDAVVDYIVIHHFLSSHVL